MHIEKNNEINEKLLHQQFSKTLVLYEHVNKEWVKLSQFYVLLTNVKSESMYEKSTPQKNS